MALWKEGWWHGGAAVAVQVDSAVTKIDHGVAIAGIVEDLDHAGRVRVAGRVVRRVDVAPPRGSRDRNRPVAGS